MAPLVGDEIRYPEDVRSLCSLGAARVVDARADTARLFPLRHIDLILSNLYTDSG
jgi:hypothetical protein